MGHLRGTVVAVLSVSVPRHPRTWSAAASCCINIFSSVWPLKRSFREVKLPALFELICRYSEVWLVQNATSQGLRYNRIDSSLDGHHSDDQFIFFNVVNDIRLAYVFCSLSLEGISAMMLQTLLLCWGCSLFPSVVVTNSLGLSTCVFSI